MWSRGKELVRFLVMVTLSKNQINFRRGAIIMFFIENRNTIIFLLVNSWVDIWMFTCMHVDQAAHLFSHLNRES